MIAAAVTGYFTAFSLILAIGAQNAFVLRQGLAHRHVFAVALFCAVSDAILISAGVLGFARVVQAWPALPVFMAWFGAAFLFVYGALRFKDAATGASAMDLDGPSAPLWKSLAVCAALTWANPHVYLDTLALIGAVSTTFTGPNEKLVYAIAATTASFTFFFSLAYGARLLAPLMRTARTWAVLDTLIGLTMWVIAVTLVASTL